MRRPMLGVPSANLVGPITITGNLTVTGTLTVQSTSALQGNLTLTGHLLWNASNTYDVGASGTTTRTGYFGTQLSVVQGSITTSTPALTHTATWNAGAVTFTNLLSNVTDTASAAASLLLDLQVGGASKLKVDKTGVLTLGTALAVGQGGTGLTVGTSGGIPYFNATTTMASSALLTANALVLGGGAGAAPTVVGSLGTTTTLLHGNAAGAPTFGAVTLTTDVTGTLPVGSGGSGATTFTANGVLYGNTTSAIQVTAQGAANSVLTANAGAPSFSAAPTIGTSITTPIAIGGTSTTSTLSLRSTSGVGAAGADIIFQTGNNGATEAMRILNSGNTGIGTNNPGKKLEVSTGTDLDGIRLGATGAGIRPRIIIDRADAATASTASQILFTMNSVNLGMIEMDSGAATNSGILALYTNNAGSFAERVRIDNAGNVGIGTTSPSALLHVGLAGTTLGVIGVAGNTSGLVKIQPAAAAGTWTLTLPTAAGSSGQTWTTDGTGIMSFGTLGVGGGGTGATTFTANGVLYGNTTGAVLVTAQGGTNSVLTASAGAPSFSATPTVTSLTATGAIKSTGATSGIGYGTGAGGTVTQLTSKSTGVTLNTITGQITMNGAALAGNTIVSFTLTNSAIAATDLLVLNHVATGTVGSYLLNVQPGAGSAVINVTNITAGSLSEAIVVGFAVIKAVTA